jgi:hypothetical protein
LPIRACSECQPHWSCAITKVKANTNHLKKAKQAGTEWVSHPIDFVALLLHNQLQNKQSIRKLREVNSTQSCLESGRGKSHLDVNFCVVENWSAPLCQK